jgi:hypothetical protein
VDFELGLVERLWIKLRKESVLALYTPFILCLASKHLRIETCGLLLFEFVWLMGTLSSVWLIETSSYVWAKLRVACVLIEETFQMA